MKPTSRMCQIRKHAQLTAELLSRAPGLQLRTPDAFFLDPLTKTAWVPLNNPDLVIRVAHCFTTNVLGVGQEIPDGVLVKAANPLTPITSTLQLTPNSLNRFVGGPTPLLSTMAGGLLGAGLGYGGGWLAERLLPEHFEKGRLRRLGMVLGGMAGTVPGLAMGLAGHQSATAEGKSGWPEWLKPNRIFNADQRSDLIAPARSIFDIAPIRFSGVKNAVDNWGTFYDPTIDAPKMLNEVQRDAYLTQPVQDMTQSLLATAMLSRQARLISPSDIANIALGAGSGLASATLVGKVLGALAGLRPEAQHQLQQAGLYAGVLANAVPLVFGTR